MSSQQRGPATDARPPSRASVRTEVVRRSAVFGLLDRAVTGPLTVLRGPAGTGKSTVLSSWLAEPETPLPGPVGRLTVRPEHDEHLLEPFWRTALEAIGLAVPATNENENETKPFRVGHVVTTLEQLPHDAVLVVDDLHRAEPAVIGSIGEVVRRCPRLHVVAATRKRLPLCGQRQQLAGLAFEIDATDLAYSSDETATALALAGLTIGSDVLTTLHELTGGWPAAVELAIRGLSKYAEPDRVTTAELTALVLRNLTFYVREELLTDPADDETGFLLRTSIVDILTPGLASALSGEPDCRRRLTSLAADTILVDASHTCERLSYPTVLREVLRGEQRRRLPSETGSLHSRAARWYAEHGQALLAMRHAHLAENWPLLSELLVRHWIRLVLDHSRELRDLLAAIPESARADPELLAIPVGCLVADGRETGLVVDQIQHALEQLRGEPTLVRTPRLEALAAAGAMFVERFRGHSEESLGIANATLDRLAEFPDAALGSAADATAIFHLHHGNGLRQAGRLDDADAAFRRLQQDAEHADVGPLVVRAQGELALSAAWRGRLDSATRYVELAEARAVGQSWMSTLVGIPAHLAAGLVAIERADPSRAAGYLERVRMLHGARPGHLVELMYARTLYAQLVDDPSSGLESRRAILEELRGWTPPRFGTAVLAACGAELLLARGDLVEANRCVEGIESLPGAPLSLTALRARILVARDDPVAAYALLGSELAHLDDLPARARLELLIAAATSAHLHGEDVRAVEYFRRALALAGVTGARRPFLTQPPECFKLLTAYVRTTDAAPSERRLLDQLEGIWQRLRGDSLESRLSPRERFILAYLVNGSTVREMSVQLHVSQNTLKTQLRSIYRKLDVGSRDQAVAFARAHRLI